MSKPTSPANPQLVQAAPVGWRAVAALWAQRLLRALLLGIIIGLPLVMSAALVTSQTSGFMYLLLLNANLLLLAGILVFIGRRVALMFIERRKGLIGTRMHVRLMGVFSLVAVMPTVLVSVCAIFLINQGIEAWFSQRVTRALDGSLEVAQAYFREHGNRLLSEAEAIARDPALRTPGFLLDSEAVRPLLRQEQTERGLSEIALYSAGGELVAYAGDVLPAAPSVEMLQTFMSTDMGGRVLVRHTEGRIVAISRVNSELFLVLTRWLHPSVLAHLDDTRAAFQEYYELRSERDMMRYILIFMLILLMFVSLAWAIWAGFKMAGRVVRPVTALVHATNEVSAGDFDVHVDPMDDDELGILTQAFNRMTRQLRENRALLERKNRELDDRRKMTEAVFTGVTAGVMSLDDGGTIKLTNKTARELLGVRVGARLGNAVPELQSMLEQLLNGHDDLSQQQVRIKLEDGRSLTLLVRMVPQRVGGGKIAAVVITFDDITELLGAQRLAAWSDVARRIAHEIKNPLTPIQLSAERLKRKYGKQIEDDKETFLSLTDTISRQVEDMRRLVNEFSDFARMPAADFAEHDLVHIINDLLVLERSARPGITFESSLPASVPLVCDRAQMSRVLTNLVENGEQNSFFIIFQMILILKKV